MDAAKLIEKLDASIERHAFSGVFRFPNTGMTFAQRERLSYSNGGHILLGVVIEEVTGIKYRDFVEQAIFRNSGMNQSGLFALD